jgi:hypothetical protein
VRGKPDPILTQPATTCATAEAKYERPNMADDSLCAMTMTDDMCDALFRLAKEVGWTQAGGRCGCGVCGKCTEGIDTLEKEEKISKAAPTTQSIEKTEKHIQQLGCRLEGKEREGGNINHTEISETLQSLVCESRSGHIRTEGKIDADRGRGRGTDEGEQTERYASAETDRPLKKKKGGGGIRQV